MAGVRKGQVWQIKNKLEDLQLSANAVVNCEDELSQFHQMPQKQVQYIATRGRYYFRSHETDGRSLLDGGPCYEH